jgi:hypothetical protein
MMIEKEGKKRREIRKRNKRRERKERKKERKKEGYDRKWLKGNSDGRDQVEGREIFLSVFFRQINQEFFQKLKKISFAIALVISCCIEKLEVISIAK